jgi:hypothetical protein
MTRVLDSSCLLALVVPIGSKLVDVKHRGPVIRYTNAIGDLFAVTPNIMLVTRDFEKRHVRRTEMRGTQWIAN